MSVDTTDAQANQYSADGHWLWDGQRWTPVGGTDQLLTAQPLPDHSRAEGGNGAGLALALGIGAISVAVVTVIFSFVTDVSRIADAVLTTLLAIGFLTGELAVVFGLRGASRPRRPSLIAGFVCGLAGMGLLLLLVASLTIRY
jgi:hypothetical protein